ncbi:D-arabinono-1,4-lactone oxidase [Lapillicoccus jejuensis]|uniref:FAD-linked oxidoreductase n=1 Tax=Lapillicoccus jejuensis TaxID=402171 RepID=A0A542DV98_9MICO|nr:D-arabinono-1,4-lactone oxidase [Lapillicoccus jejuensis]TQJ07021.1 FAD-linked oxidoreductase [Lapillicoccus jejuensis]
MTTTVTGGGVLRPGERWRNWGRVESAAPAHVARPRSVEEVVAVVQSARERGLRVKAVGAGHSFTPIAMTDGVSVDVSALSGVLGVDRTAGRVRLGAGTHLHELPRLLAPYGLALENMGDIDAQTIAGAVSTGTHGTGAAFRGLAANVVGAVLVTGTGEVLAVGDTPGGEADADLLPAVALSLGALGVVVEVTVQCVPAFLLRAVERPLPLAEVLDGFEGFMASTDHVEFYWWPHTDVVMTKANTRLPAGTWHEPPSRVRTWVEKEVVENAALQAVCELGHRVSSVVPSVNRLATRLYGERSVTDVSPRVFTSPRWVRFRECEYALPVEAVPDAVRALRQLVEASGWAISFPVEVRVAASDDVWLSTASGRASGYVAVHRFWKEDHEPYFRAVDALMCSFDGRPHWGKIHYQDATELAGRYPRMADFTAVRDRLDPDRVFANRYLDRVLGP